MDEELLKRIDKAINEASASLNSPKVKGKNSFYALIVKSRFDAISKLLEGGMTFEALFDYFVKCGVLSEDGNPGSLQQAYRREVLKKIKKAETKNDDTQNTKQAPHRTSVLEGAPEGEEKADSGEVKRKGIGSVFETAAGRIRKNPNGSFDYD